MFPSLSRSRKNLYKALVVLLLAATSPLFASTGALEPNGLVRGDTGADAELFRLDLPSPGVATFDVMTPRLEENPVRLEVLPSGGDRVGDALVVERSATHLVLAVRVPGTWWLRVSTRDPGRYKLVTGFTEAESREETSAIPGKTEPEIVDPDPDTLTGGTCAPAGQEDDHGDTLACATPLVLSPLVPPQGTLLSQRIAGEIGNGWGDDVDVFVLTLREVATVEVTIDGDAVGTFHDRTGQRLAADDGSDGRAVTLGPGRYYVRVEGDGVPGAYELTVAARPW